ncbi:thioredoxin domain-containing protein, partial [Candidatus Woesearchaeota archaeon]|nr:thioredoxin domain-containing protein [Candidatus Woesearchaeota archaeon]
MAKYENKLINETSPYLLQHAHNPVDWYPWSKEALEKTKKENKPIFLSIGYSTCHWCHVMEKESFEDVEIASFLNKNFVSIKVDREERPDIDAAYMQFSVNTTGSGGWPLNVFLTPAQKPFFSGTYFPKEEKYNIPSFLDILKFIKKQFDENKEKLGADLKKEEKEEIKFHELNDEPINNFNKVFEQYYDTDYGGLMSVPKFPITLSLLFNLEQDKHLEKVQHTLKMMGNGGIYDHLAGGFSRYSTDRQWIAPHFEKTLYDNALLLEAYSKTYSLTKNIYFKEKADGIYNYLKTNLLSKNGFYSGQDADSEGEEGKFYIFKLDEIKQNTKYSDLFIKYFNITKEGNFEGKNILNVADEFFSQKEKDKVEQDKKILLKYRNKRVAPETDTKIIISWNSLAISAFAVYGEETNNKEAVDLAEEKLNKILRDCKKGNKLFRIYGKEDLAGFLEDYSFALNALLGLYKIKKIDKYLKQAKELAEIILDIFYKGNGEFSFISKLNERL